VLQCLVFGAPLSFGVNLRINPEIKSSRSYVGGLQSPPVYVTDFLPSELSVEERLEAVER